MYRIVLVVLMALAAQAREVESGLGALRQRVQTHALVRSNSSALHHRAAVVSGTLGETAAALDQLGGQDAPRQLAYLRERLLAAEGATFTYDKNGNLVSKSTASGTTKYAWDIENRLVRVDLPDNASVTYKYDPFGRRIEKNVNGVVTTYLYDGNAILQELDAYGQMTAGYTDGPGIDWPLVLEREGQTWFYHADALGGVIALTDSSSPRGRPRGSRRTSGSTSGTIRDPKT